MLSMSTRSGRARRAAKRQNEQITTPFANDPTRLPPIHFSPALSSPLPNQQHLSTGLIDLLLHYSFRFPERGFTMPTDLLIGSANTMEILNLFNDTTKFPTSSTETMEHLRSNHSAYGSSPYRLLVPNCVGTDAHFFAVDLEFDINSDDVFRYVKVYDSLGPVFDQRTSNHDTRRTRTTTKRGGTTTTTQQQEEKATTKVLKTSSAGKFLRCLQTFLTRYCFTHKQASTQYGLLQSNPDYIIDRASYEKCPRQSNTWDCGLFSLAIVLHLANNIPITQNVFDQEHISRLRSSLHQEFSANTTGTGTRSGMSLRFLSPQFIYSFFPNLSPLLPSASHRSVRRLFGAGSSSPLTDHHQQKSGIT